MFKDLDTRFRRPCPMSTVEPTVPGLPSTLIGLENGGFPERSSNRRNLKTMTLRSDFPVWVFLKHKSKMTSDCCLFKFLRRCEERKRLMRFQSEPPFSNSSGAVWTALLELLWVGGRGNTWSWFSSCNCYYYYLMNGSTKFMGEKLYSSLTSGMSSDERARAKAMEKRVRGERTEKNRGHLPRARAYSPINRLVIKRTIRAGEGKNSIQLNWNSWRSVYCDLNYHLADFLCYSNARKNTKCCLCYFLTEISHRKKSQEVLQNYNAA